MDLIKPAVDWRKSGLKSATMSAAVAKLFGYVAVGHRVAERMLSGLWNDCIYGLDERAKRPAVLNAML
eukprot:scaffold136319_cov18-Prasinocladus_malaysianus.AAC.1